MNIGKLLSGLISKLAKNETIKTAVLSAALNVAASNIDKAGSKLKVPTSITEVAKAAVVEEVLKRAIPKL